MSEQITLHYQCRLCGKQLDRGIHLGPPSPGTLFPEVFFAAKPPR